MSRPRLYAILFGLLLVVVLAVILWPRGGDPVSRAIRDHVAKTPEQPIELAALGGPAWDRVYFFPPYTTRSEVEAALGITWPKLGGSEVETSDAVTFVVFLKGRKVVHSFDHPRVDGDFSQIKARAGLGRDQARFVARREGGEGFPVMALAAPPPGPPQPEPAPEPEPPDPSTAPATVPTTTTATAPATSTAPAAETEP